MTANLAHAVDLVAQTAAILGTLDPASDEARDLRRAQAENLRDLREEKKGIQR